MAFLAPLLSLDPSGFSLLVCFSSFFADVDAFHVFSSLAILTQEIFLMLTKDMFFIVVDLLLLDACLACFSWLLCLFNNSLLIYQHEISSKCFWNFLS